MRTNFISQSKDDKQKNFWDVLMEKLNLKSSLMKMASKNSVENPREIVKEGLVISYKPSGEYVIKLGHKSDIVVTGVAKQEKELHQHVKRALSYLKSISPKVEAELRTIEAGKRDILVYKDIDRCRDCVFYESDTSHETYRDKCKNCVNATLGGTINNFFPRSQQLVMYAPQWEQIGDTEPKVAFSGSISLLDAHKKGMANERNPEFVANDVIALAKEKSAVSLGTALFKYFAANKLNFQKYAKPVIESIEKQSGVQIHIRKGNDVMLAFAKEGESVINIGDMHVSDEGTIKLRELPEVAEGTTINREHVEDEEKEEKTELKQEIKDSKKEMKLSKRAEDENVKFKKYERVHLKSDPNTKGPYMEIQDSKPGDIDVLVVMDKAYDGYNIIEVMPAELETDGGQATPEQKSEADSEFVKYMKEHEKYETDFEEKVEGIVEGDEIAQKEASKKTKKVPGSLSKCDQEALDKYEEAKDNVIKSKEIMPKGSEFVGTLCIAEVSK
jgi:hypothetical protein